MSRHETLDIHNYLYGVKENGEEYKVNHEKYMENTPCPRTYTENKEKSHRYCGVIFH